MSKNVFVKKIVLTKMSSFWQFFDIQMAIFLMVSAQVSRGDRDRP